MKIDHRRKDCVMWASTSAPTTLGGDTICDHAERFIIMKGVGKSSRLFRLDERGATSIGRHADCGITVDDPHCSRVHCKIVELPGERKLLHVSRTNSTRVNGKPVTSTSLHDGDVIEIGKSVFTFSVVPPTALQLDNDSAA